VATELALPNRELFRTYASWAARVGLAFFAVYPTLNWLTSLRTRPHKLFIPAELAVPFVPELIWAYLSMYVLFLLPLFLLPAERMAALGKQLVAGTVIAGLVFLALPAELGFARAVPQEPTTRGSTQRSSASTSRTISCRRSMCFSRPRSRLRARTRRDRSRESCCLRGLRRSRRLQCLFISTMSSIS
jgi:hypothetical protein